MSDEGEIMARAMAGHLQNIIQEKTGVDVRGVKDPYPLWLISRLERWARIKKREHAIRLLSETKSREIIVQNSEIYQTLKSDISILALMSGNKPMSEGVNDEVI